ncbi:MAG TPA: hypothetical protein PLF81_28300, partial [Candidatus Anammoximicrobium sp.]|nr:hypothetical protein [Candidatus Anammoximicrobium sp.]
MEISNDRHTEKTVRTVLQWRRDVVEIAACWWFKNDRGGPAFLAWEANGPGQEFQKRVLETDFGKGLLLPQ